MSEKISIPVVESIKVALQDLLCSNAKIVLIEMP